MGGIAITPKAEVISVETLKPIPVCMLQAKLQAAFMGWIASEAALQ